MKPQAEIQVARRNISNLRYADGTTLMAESGEELKSLLIKVKEESEKSGLKLNIHKTKMIASGPITSWQNRWGNSGNSDKLYFLRLQNNWGWSHEIKRHLFLERKTMANLDILLKSRDTTLLTMVHTVKAMVFQ